LEGRFNPSVFLSDANFIFLTNFSFFDGFTSLLINQLPIVGNSACFLYVDNRTLGKLRGGDFIHSLVPNVKTETTDNLLIND
jgi:hypothetical protein